MGAEFIHLHTHSAYSLAEGAIPVKTLVKKARAMKMPALAMTDTGNLFGAMEFSLEAAKAGLQPILGAQISYWL
jgi:DNA polymerase-3 subunit alpha